MSVIVGRLSLRESALSPLAYLTRETREQLATPVSCASL